MGADSKGLTVNGAEALHLDLIGLMGGADCEEAEQSFLEF
jgi:hypothetical protein